MQSKPVLGSPQSSQNMSVNDVICFLFSFQGAFSEFALFFYDKYGGTIIAVVWKPAAFEPQLFKV